MSVFIQELNISSFVEGYDPELPVLKSAVLHVLIELLHVVKADPPDRHPCCRQLFLTRAAIFFFRTGGGEKKGQFSSSAYHKRGETYAEAELT